MNKNNSNNNKNLKTQICEAFFFFLAQGETSERLARNLGAMKMGIRNAKDNHYVCG